MKIRAGHICGVKSLDRLDVVVINICIALALELLNMDMKLSRKLLQISKAHTYSSALMSQLLAHWCSVQLVSQENTSDINFSKRSKNLVSFG